MGPWGEFGACSKTCTPANQTSGERRSHATCPGSQERSRRCLPPRNGGRPCGGDLVESRLCGSQACPGARLTTIRLHQPWSEWTEWSAWGGCSVSCGQGLRSAERRCLPRGAVCPGEPRREGGCGEDPCPGGSCLASCLTIPQLTASGRGGSPGPPAPPVVGLGQPLALGTSRVHTYLMSDDCGRERAVEQRAVYGGRWCQEGGGVETERCDWLNECPGWLGKHVSTGHQWRAAGPGGAPGPPLGPAQGPAGRAPGGTRGLAPAPTRGKISL